MHAFPIIVVLVALVQVACTESLQDDPGEEVLMKYEDEFKPGGDVSQFYSDKFVGDYMELRVTTKEELSQGRVYRGKDGSATEVIFPYDQKADLESGEVVWGTYIFKNDNGEVIELGRFFSVLNSDNKIIVDVMWRDFFYKD